MTEQENTKNFESQFVMENVNLENEKQKMEDSLIDQQTLSRRICKLERNLNRFLYFYFIMFIVSVITFIFVIIFVIILFANSISNSKDLSFVNTQIKELFDLIKS
jgi:hypothetical protein